MDAQTIFYIALGVAGVVLVVILAVVLLSIRRNVEHMTQRFDESLRQVEMTAEDLRKTNAVVRGILSDVEQGVSNVTHLTEGVRSLRGPVDVATKVLAHTLTPALINAGSALLGFKAATSHILDRIVRKEGRK
jgi:uncharacterized protein YoxC